MARKIGYGSGGSRGPSEEELIPRPYSSECVADLEYDIETQEMTIHFHKRGSYVYHDVDPQTFSEMNFAGSRGEYFNNYIRGSYSYERIG